MALAARVYQHDDLPDRPSTKPRPRVIRKTRLVKVRLDRTVRLGLLVALPIALIVTYVWLTAQLTAQTYRLHDDQALRNALVQRDNELRQQVAQLESLPRLESAAAKLHMHVPQSVAIVAPSHAATTKTATSIAATIDGLRKWLHI
ncbi:MAG TPA: hypothetical protein VFO25_01405 [Candidatus Eremiobacteraceae bacterium]|nr:hypothetical protein [Candidatus Eremiobacteraceae bacterium]